jgi:hypothetical protein
MKPRLRFSRGVWWCGFAHQHGMYWSCAETPEAAFELWARFTQSVAAADSAAQS